MENRSDIVIVIPFCNEEKYVLSTLTSLKEQRISSKISWSIIFVDNRSTDKTAKIIRNFFKNTNIAYTILYEPKRGTVYSRTLGLMAAVKQAKHIIISTDADTVLPEVFVERTYEDIRTYGADVISGRRKSIPEISLWKRIISKEQCNWNRKVFNLEFNIFGPYFFGSYFAIKTNLFASIPEYYPVKHRRYMGEDILLSRRCHYMGATIKQSTAMVIPHPRRQIALQGKLSNTFVGNNLYSHARYFSMDSIRYQKSTPAQNREILKQTVKFETGRFLWMTVDAYKFWEETGYRYRNAYDSFVKAADFISTSKHDLEELSRGKIQTQAYARIRKIYFNRTQAKIKKYLVN